MEQSIPIYRGRSETLHADTCRPLVDAAAARSVQFEALARGHYPGRRLPKNAMPSVKTVGYWDAPVSQPWGLEWHRNEGIEFMFLESGRVGFAVDDHELVLKPNDLTFTRPWQVHRVGNPNVGACRLHWLIIDVGVRRPNQPWKWPSWLMLNGDEMQELTHILRHTARPVWQVAVDIRRRFQSIAQAVETDRNGSNVTKLTIRINDLLLMLLEHFRGQKPLLDQSLSGSRRAVQLFLEDLATHPEQLVEQWTIGAMARTCGLGVSQFVHHVRQLTNLPPMHFLNDCRLILAAKLLQDQPNRSVLDIALSCGFSSSPYFATLFGKRFGLAPRDFRRQATGGVAVALSLSMSTPSAPP
jgi:AraC-like DNA-binding protein/mannose-6-phosphate isomerase-like protein (cupin superfamily)